MSLRFALITCSDTRNLKDDFAGARLKELIESQGWQLISHLVVPDERTAIAEALIQACDCLHADVCLTCGGTGLSMRDVTPEATLDVADRLVPGIAEALRAYSLTITPRAMLSRGIAAQRATTLIVNFPGSQKAAQEYWEALWPQLEHAYSMTHGGKHEQQSPSHA